MVFDAVLFDCDGVLVDSEPITNRVLRDMLEARGWRISLPECMRIFVGTTVRDHRAAIEAHTGQPLTEAWLAQFRATRDLALAAELEPIPGVHDAVAAAHRLTGGRVACASGADRVKLELQLQKVGLLPQFAGAIFSGQELPRNKPHPDVYLAAAAHWKADPARCLVIEDTPTGTMAGHAAGATVWAYCPDPARAEALRAAGASRLFATMSDLQAVLLAAC